MVSDDTLHAEEMIQNGAKEDQCSITIDDRGSQDGRATTSLATSVSNDGVDTAGNDIASAHHGYFCDGEACTNQPHLPIVGKRYECLSCKKAKYPHNLCHACHEKYPLKSEKTSLSPSHECVNPSTFSSVSFKKPEDKIGDIDDGKKSFRGIALHVFKPIDAPKGNNERLGNTNSADKSVKDELINVLNADFDTMTFVMQVLVLYPLAFLVYILGPIPADAQKRRKRFYEMIDSRYHYFERLPMLQIGPCWVLNILAMKVIYLSTRECGIVMTAYWIFVYEVFFMQSVIAQVQLHLAGDKYSAVTFALFAMTGWSIRNLGEKFWIRNADVAPYINRQCSIETSGRAMKFVVQVAPVDEPCGSGQDQDLVVDPAKTLLFGARTPVHRSYKAFFFWIVAAGLVAVVSIANAVPSDSFFLFSVFQSSIGNRMFKEYSIRNVTIDKACNVNNDSTYSFDTNGRAFVNIELYEMPYVEDDSPTLNVSFYLNDMPNLPINFWMEALWGASFLNNTPTTLNLQYMTYHDTIGIVLLFPDISCGSLSNLTCQQNTNSNQPVDAFYDFAFSWDFQNAFILIAFECLILLPFLVSFALQQKHICVAILHTWDYWDAFDSFTRTGNDEGVWVTDMQAKHRVDFMQTINCHTWFGFRKLLIKITSINMRFAISLLRIAITQFVLSMAIICWYIVKGSAPFPGFLLLISLCSNSLATLVLLYPLHNIWIIQSSHEALISEKYHQAVSLPLSNDPQTLERQRHVASLLHGMKTALESCDERVSLLGFEVSYGFLWTLGTFAVSGISFLCGSKTMQYYVYTGQTKGGESY